MQAETQAKLEVRAARVAKVAKEKKEEAAKGAKGGKEHAKGVDKCKVSKIIKKKDNDKTKGKHRWLPCALHGRCHLHQQWQTCVQGLSQQELHQRGQGELGEEMFQGTGLGKSLGPVD